MRQMGFALICAGVFISGALLFSNNILSAAEDQAAQYEKKLADARKEAELYKKGLMEGPVAAGIKKEAAALDASAKAKGRELASILDSKLEKNPAYLELVAKTKELDRVNSEIRKIRSAADSDPDVRALQKESAELRARAAAKDQEARRLADSKYNADPKLKDLLTKKSLVANAGKEAADFKKAAMNDPQIKKLQAESSDLKKQLTAKNSRLRAATDNLLKTDVRLKALESRVTELNKQAAESRKGQSGPAKIVGQQIKPPAKQPPQEESLMDRLKRKLGKK